ncbi:protein lin-52 homolog isoform X1 [Protopterus annectens]|uniref:protein lin-52 homolog isoform X1 n=1 Tax=Protopterus annectens TaxID=7888 RepID=UPI001CFAF574|nr:protein lin-52 homolog isoform X1 [Protopterus annectens]
MTYDKMPSRTNKTVKKYVNHVTVAPSPRLMMSSSVGGVDLETSLLSFEKLDRASPDLWPEQLPGVAEFAASFKSPITASPPKWMAELETDDIDMLKELGSLTTANLMEKVRGLQNLAYQLGLDECSLLLGWSCSYPCCSVASLSDISLHPAGPYSDCSHLMFTLPGLRLFGYLQDW